MRSNEQRLILFSVLLALLSDCNNTQEKKLIGLQPLGVVQREYLDTITSRIEHAYKFNVVKLPELPMRKGFFTNIKSPRYRADSIIYFFKHNKPDSIDIILSITEKDISVTKRDFLGRIKEPASKYTDWGVFGYGYRPGSSCVVSAYRLKGTNKQQTFERISKVALHEIGHNLGLPHCEVDKCVMQDAAEKIATIDRVNASLCDRCRKKL